MKGLHRAVLPLVLAGTVSGCDLEFVDVEVGRPANFTAFVYADADSVVVTAALYPGVDEAHRARNVVEGLLIDGEVREPELTSNEAQRWRLRLPDSAAGRGYLHMAPPRLEGLTVPRQMLIPIPYRSGARDIDVPPGDPIAFEVTFAPVPSDSDWQISLSDAEDRRIYLAQAQHFPSGPIYIPDEAIPGSAPGPYEASLQVGARWHEEPEKGKYEVGVWIRGIFVWSVRRGQASAPDSHPLSGVRHAR